MFIIYLILHLLLFQLILSLKLTEQSRKLTPFHLLLFNAHITYTTANKLNCVINTDASYWNFSVDSQKLFLKGKLA